MEAVNGVSDGGGPPPPSPLTGCYLLIVIGEPHSQEHKNIILQRIAKGLLSWDVNDCLIDLEKELAIINEQAPEGEEARYGERLIQYASENLVTEVLIHPAVSTLAQCVRNLLSSFTRHRHIIHAGYTFATNGSWILQDGTFSYTDFAEAFHEIEVQRVIRAYENSISVDLHCSLEGDWIKLPKEPFTKNCKVRVNPVDVLTSGSPPITNFLNYISPFLVPTDVETLLECSDVVGNIRFSHPTLYIFPGGQGDAALFGINGFNMLLDGGFARKACFWDFVRHLDRLDAVLLTRLNNGNVCGISAVLRRKMQNALYPQIGHFFCNIQERKSILSPDGDKDKDPLLINLLDEGQEIITNLRKLNLTPQMCYRDSEPINLYHKVGHGTLDMYVLSPAKESKEVKDFLHRWNTNDQKLFANQKNTKDFQFPLQNLVSICALLIWQPANPNDNITRILYPGSTSQQKIFEGLDKLKNLEYIKYPVCSESKLITSSSIMALKSKQLKDASLEKLIQPESKKTEKIKDKPPKSGEIKSRLENKIIDNLEKLEMTNGVSSENEVDKTVKKSDSTDSDKSGKSTKPRKVEQKVEERKPKSKESMSRPRAEHKPDKKKSLSEKKPSPTTPKKTMDTKVNGEMREKEKPTSKPIRYSPSATPAKSAKEATNRKVIESKNRMAAKKEAKTLSEKKDTKPERKPISRRSKGQSPTTKTVSSPIKKVNGVQKPDIIKKAKLDKEGTTDSSTVSTPSADQKDLTKLTSEEIEQLKAQELADLKEEQEVVKEIEAVFRKGEIEKNTDTELRKVKDISMEDKSEPEEYLIIEKEEVEHDSLDDKEIKEDETQKHTRDSEESEKMRKFSDEIKISLKDKEELRKQESEEAADFKDKEDKEKPAETPKEISITSPEDKVDTSIDKKVGDVDNQEQNVALESQPDERYSATAESGATTAPTLPEDERITLDEIKEDNGDQVIKEKHVKEDTKEKDVPVIQLPAKTFETVTKLPPVVGIRLDKQAHIRDIVKTPDEVADLPVHEEADIEQYHIDVMKSNIKSEDLRLEIKPQEKVEVDIKEEKEKDTTVKDIKEDIPHDEQKPKESLGGKEDEVKQRRDKISDNTIQKEEAIEIEPTKEVVLKDEEQIAVKGKELVQPVVEQVEDKKVIELEMKIEKPQLVREIGIEKKIELGKPEESVDAKREMKPETLKKIEDVEEGKLDIQQKTEKKEYSKSEVGYEKVDELKDLVIAVKTEEQEVKDLKAEEDTKDMKAGIMVDEIEKGRYSAVDLELQAQGRVDMKAEAKPEIAEIGSLKTEDESKDLKMEVKDLEKTEEGKDLKSPVKSETVEIKSLEKEAKLDETRDGRDVVQEIESHKVEKDLKLDNKIDVAETTKDLGKILKLDQIEGDKDSAKEVDPKEKGKKKDLKLDAKSKTFDETQVLEKEIKLEQAEDVKDLPEEIELKEIGTNKILMSDKKPELTEETERIEEKDLETDVKAAKIADLTAEIESEGETLKEIKDLKTEPKPDTVKEVTMDKIEDLTESKVLKTEVKPEIREEGEDFKINDQAKSIDPIKDRKAQGERLEDVADLKTETEQEKKEEIDDLRSKGTSEAKEQKTDLQTEVKFNKVEESLDIKTEAKLEKLKETDDKQTKAEKLEEVIDLKQPESTETKTKEIKDSKADSTLEKPEESKDFKIEDKPKEIDEIKAQVKSEDNGQIQDLEIETKFEKLEKIKDEHTEIKPEKLDSEIQSKKALEAENEMAKAITTKSTPEVLESKPETLLEAEDLGEEEDLKTVVILKQADDITDMKAETVTERVQETKLKLEKLEEAKISDKAEKTNKTAECTTQPEKESIDLKIEVKSEKMFEVEHDTKIEKVGESIDLEAATDTLEKDKDLKTDIEADKLAESKDLKVEIKQDKMEETGDLKIDLEPAKMAKSDKVEVQLKTLTEIADLKPEVKTDPLKETKHLQTEVETVKEAVQSEIGTGSKEEEAGNKYIQPEETEYEKIHEQLKTSQNFELDKEDQKVEKGEKAKEGKVDVIELKEKEELQPVIETIGLKDQVKVDTKVKDENQSKKDSDTEDRQLLVEKISELVYTEDEPLEQKTLKEELEASKFETETETVKIDKTESVVTYEVKKQVAAAKEVSDEIKVTDVEKQKDVTTYQKEILEHPQIPVTGDSGMDHLELIETHHLKKVNGEDTEVVADVVIQKSVSKQETVDIVTKQETDKKHEKDNKVQGDETYTEKLKSGIDATQLETQVLESQSSLEQQTKEEYITDAEGVVEESKQDAIAGKVLENIASDLLKGVEMKVKDIEDKAIISTEKPEKFEQEKETRVIGLSSEVVVTPDELQEDKVKEYISDNEVKLSEMESEEGRDVTFYIGDEKLEKSKVEQKGEKMDSKEQKKSQIEEKDIDDKQKQTDEQEDIPKEDDKLGEKKADECFKSIVADKIISSEEGLPASLEETKEDTKLSEDAEDGRIKEKIVAPSKDEEQKKTATVSSYETIYDSNKYSNGVENVEEMQKPHISEKGVIEDEKGTKEIAEQQVKKETEEHKPAEQPTDIALAKVLNGEPLEDDKIHIIETPTTTANYETKEIISEDEKSDFMKDLDPSKKSFEDLEETMVISDTDLKKDDSEKLVDKSIVAHKETPTKEEKSGSQAESPETSPEQSLPTLKENEILDKVELGRKSPKEREQDVAIIVASVAEVLKSDAPLEEFEGKIPLTIAPFVPFTATYTTELRETHITTVDSPVSDTCTQPIPEETQEIKPLPTPTMPEGKKEETDVKESKISTLLRDSKELMEATSKIISDIKSTKAEDIKSDDTGTVHRMLVTASSEDGGEEIEICPKGTITFSKSSESSGRSSPDQSTQKLKLEDDKITSKGSTPDAKITSEQEKADLESTEKESTDKGTVDESTLESAKKGSEILEQSPTHVTSTKDLPESAVSTSTLETKNIHSSIETEKRSSDSGRSTPESIATKMETLVEPRTKIAFDSGRSSPGSKSIDDIQLDEKMEVKSGSTKSALGEKSETDKSSDDEILTDKLRDQSIKEDTAPIVDISELTSAQKGGSLELTKTKDEISSTTDSSEKSTSDAIQSIISKKSSPDLKQESGSLVSRIVTPEVKEIKKDAQEVEKVPEVHIDLKAESIPTSEKSTTEEILRDHKLEHEVSDIYKGEALESKIDEHVKVDEIPPSYEDLEQAKMKMFNGESPTVLKVSGTVIEKQESEDIVETKTAQKEIYTIKDEEDNIIKKEIKIEPISSQDVSDTTDETVHHIEDQSVAEDDKKKKMDLMPKKLETVGECITTEQEEIKVEEKFASDVQVQPIDVQGKAIDTEKLRIEKGGLNMKLSETEELMEELKSETVKDTKQEEIFEDKKGTDARDKDVKIKDEKVHHKLDMDVDESFQTLHKDSIQSQKSDRVIYDSMESSDKEISPSKDYKDVSDPSLRDPSLESTELSLAMKELTVESEKEPQSLKVSAEDKEQETKSECKVELYTEIQKQQTKDYTEKDKTETQIIEDKLQLDDKFPNKSIDSTQVKDQREDTQITELMVDGSHDDIKRDSIDKAGDLPAVKSDICEDSQTTDLKHDFPVDSKIDDKMSLPQPDLNNIKGTALDTKSKNVTSDEHELVQIQSETKISKDVIQKTATEKMQESTGVISSTDVKEKLLIEDNNLAITDTSCDTVPSYVHEVKKEEPVCIEVGEISKQKDKQDEIVSKTDRVPHEEDNTEVKEIKPGNSMKVEKMRLEYDDKLELTDVNDTSEIVKADLDFVKIESEDSKKAISGEVTLEKREEIGLKDQIEEVIERRKDDHEPNEKGIRVTESSKEPHIEDPKKIDVKEILEKSAEYVESAFAPKVIDSKDTEEICTKQSTAIPLDDVSKYEKQTFVDIKKETKDVSVIDQIIDEKHKEHILESTEAEKVILTLEKDKIDDHIKDAKDKDKEYLEKVDKVIEKKLEQEQTLQEKNSKADIIVDAGVALTSTQQTLVEEDTQYITSEAKDMIKESADANEHTTEIKHKAERDSDTKEETVLVAVRPDQVILKSESAITDICEQKVELEVNATLTEKEQILKKSVDISDKSLKEGFEQDKMSYDNDRLKIMTTKDQADDIETAIEKKIDETVLEKRSAKAEESKFIDSKVTDSSTKELGDSSKSSVIVDVTKAEDKRSAAEKSEIETSIKTETSVVEKTVKDIVRSKDLDIETEIVDKEIKDTVRVFIESEKDVSTKASECRISSVASSSKELSKPEESSLSGKSTPDIADVERDKQMQETLTYEKHIPGCSTPPTVPVSPIIKDMHSDVKSDMPSEKKVETSIVTTVKEQDVRSYTPGSDDYEHGVSSTHSDISISQMSRVPNVLEGEEARESDEDDILGSPTSVTSQIGHSPSSQYDFDDDKRLSKTDQMSVSFYGALPGDTDDSGFKSGRFLDDSDLDFEKAMQEHRQTRGEDLTGEPSSYLYEITTAKYGGTAKEDVEGHKTDIMTSSFIGTELPSRSTADKDTDPIGSWGKPLGLPSPAPPDNKATPKKEKKLPPNVTAKNKLNDDKKRSESPSKYDKKQRKAGAPIYVDLTYVPHHGNSNYSYVDFFKRVRARYYVFSGIEPSKEVYNALLEAKQTWEDKELEVTIIPTYDTDVLGYWVAENEELLTKYKIDLSPSASRCTINLQDHETSCSAYRLEF